MQYLVEGYPKKAEFVKAILPSMIKQLGLNNSRKSLLIRIAKECDGMGMTVPLEGLDSYVIIVRPMKLKDVGLTLAHEMVHVRQMAKGTLKMSKGNTYWNGKKYSKKTPYLDQPWERDAFARQEIIFRKAISE